MLKKLQIQTNRRDEMIDITHEAEAFLRKTGVKKRFGAHILSPYNRRHYHK